MTQHVLCAIDLGHPDTEAKILKTAAHLAEVYGATLSVVSVIPDYGMTIVGSFFKEGTMKAAVEAANQQLHDFVAKTLPNAENVQHIVEIGTVYEQILDAIPRANADLVVIGAHRPDLVDRIQVQGPNSARVARYAKCSVLVVRS